MTSIRKRVWLNPPSSDDNGYMIYGKEDVADYELKLADCHRVISFNFSYGEWESTPNKKRGIKRSIKKLDLMLKNLNELRAIMQKDLDDL